MPEHEDPISRKHCNTIIDGSGSYKLTDALLAGILLTLYDIRDRIPSHSRDQEQTG